MNTTTPQCEFLLWDTDFFKHRIARLVAPTLDEPAMQAALEWCRLESIDCLYLLTGANHTGTVRLVEDHDFRFVDIRLTIQWKAPRNWQPASPTPSLTILPFEPAHLPALRVIATGSYVLSRFYFDPCFDRQAVADLYETWLTKSTQGYADKVLTALQHDQPVGFAIFSKPPANTDQPGEIGLLGIAENTRGLGVGSALTHAALDWFISQGVDNVQIVTQGRNIPAQRLFQSFGFRSQNLQLWYHKWFKDCSPTG